MLLRMLDWDANQAAQQSGAKNPSQLAAVLAIDHNQRLTALLQEFGDSHLGQQWNDFALTAQQQGFIFQSSCNYWCNGAAQQSMWLSDQGAVLIADSYQDMVNQALIWCWCQQKPPVASWAQQTSKDAWGGSIPVRQGLIERWQQLQQLQLMKKWPQRLEGITYNPGLEWTAAALKQVRAS